jgi:hypothetical protein
VNLSNVPNLHVFSLCTILKCDALWPSVLHNIGTVLGTIPGSNEVTNLWFEFKVVSHGWTRFCGCLSQDWVGMFNEIIRIAERKPLALELEMVVFMGILEEWHSRQDELLAHIMEKAAPLLDYPKICTHFWNPTFRDRGLGPFPPGKVRSRCRR